MSRARLVRAFLMSAPMTRTPWRWCAAPRRDFPETHVSSTAA